MPTPIQWIPWEDRTKTSRTGPHSMTGKMRRLPWPYCTKCGLLALKNDATRAALRKPCNWVDDE